MVCFAVFAIYLVLCLAPMSPMARSLSASTLRLIVALVSAAASIIVWWNTTGVDRRIWRWLALATICLTIANAIQLFWIVAYGQLATSPSPDDLLLLATLAFLLLTSLTLGNPVRARTVHRVASALDFAAIMGVVFGIGYLAVLRPLGLVTSEASLLDNLMMGVYFTLPIAIAIYPFVFREDPWQMWSGLVAVGIAWGAGGYAVGGLIVQGRGLYYLGSPAVYLEHSALVAMYLYITLAAVWRLTPSVGVAAPRPASGLPRWPGLVILGVSLPIVPAAIFFALTSEDRFTAMVVGLTAAAVAVILMARTILLSVSNTELGAVREEVAHYRALVESAPVSVLVVDVTGTIVFANEAAARAVEATSAYDLVGLSARSFDPDGEGSSGAFESIVSLVRAYARTNAPSSLPVERMKLKTLRDALIDIDFTAASLTYAGRPSVLIQGIVVTDRVRAETEALHYRERLELLAAELVSSEERAYRELAEALHDQLSQPLAVARMRLQNYQHASAVESDDFTIAMEMIQQAITEARNLTTELAPAVLYDLGVTEALKWLCGIAEHRHGLPCKVVGFVRDGDLDDRRRALLFRSVKELMINVIKHARAENITLKAVDAPGSVSVTVIDDGVGFAPEASKSGTSFGLLSIEQSLAAIGGSLAIDSRPLAGTRATVTVPRDDSAD